MSALPRPELAPGPRRTLNDALHALHHRAGWPSLRALARDTGVSHTTISKTFSGPTLPTWGVLELVVEALDGDTAEFHDLWLAASTPSDRQSPRTARIAGRKTELTAVRRHLETGTGLLLVTGEAGMGKTTLVEAAVLGADVFAATGHCLPLSTEVPLLPIADCLRSVHEADGGEWFGEAVATCPPYVASSLAALLPEVGSGAADASVGADDRQLLFTSVGAALRALVGIRPLAILLEDLHWADAATLDLLEHLLGRGSPAPVLGSWRTGDDTTPQSSHDWFTRVRRQQDATVVELGPLSVEETAEQLRLLGGDDAPDRVDRIHTRSQGQPLFTEQLAAHLDDVPGLPGLLADLLDRRLDGLSETAWAVVRTLGVAERSLSPSLLGAATGLSPEELTAQQRTLQVRRLIGPAAGGAVQLHHPLLAEAVKRRLVVGEDTAAHRALAEALGTRPDAEAAEVAAHWRRAGEPEREIGWRIAAARGAAALFDRRQEAEHWLRALEIWPGSHRAAGEPPATHPEVYLAAMEALRSSFQWDRAAAMSDEADAVLGDVDEGVRADLLFMAAEYRGEREGVEVARALIEESLAIYDRLPALEGKVRALDWQQNLLMSTGQFDQAAKARRAAVRTAQELGDPVLLRDCLMRVAWHTALDGNLDEGLSLLASSASRAGVGKDPLGDVRLAVLATDVLLFCGRGADDVTSAGAPGLAVATEHGIDNYQVLLIRYNTAYALIRAGRICEAETLLDTPRGQPVDIDRWPLYALRAVIDTAHGEPVVAYERVDAVWHELAEGHATDLEFLVVLASIACWARTPGPTLGRLLRALDELVDTAPIRLVAPGLLAAARCRADRNELDGEQDDHGVLNELAVRAGLLDKRHRHDTHLAAHAATFAAEVGRASGRDRAAEWGEAAALWDELERLHDAAYCRWRDAQVALREGHGTVAARLLKKAASDAREHVPLSDAISRTAGDAR